MKDDDHDQRDGGGLEPEDRAFIAELLRSARLEKPPADIELQVMRGLARRRAAGESAWSPGVRARRAALAAALLAAAAALVFWVRREPTTQGLAVVAEPRSLRSNAPASACAHPLHAGGGEPAIDDFEDGDGAVLPLEGRRGVWIEVRDVDAPGRSRPLLPALRPQEVDHNRFALHVVGGELRDWGANTQFSFEPPCYDASIYAGIAFSARGPGRVYLSVSEVRVVSVDYGGTCTRDCYNAHARKIDLTGTWQRYEVRWSELHQRGYETPPLDPRSLHTVAFVVRAEDTPYDLWIDDVAFLPPAP
jgi:hypothetical protein